MVERACTALLQKLASVIDATTGRLVVKNLIFKDTRLPATAEESFRTRELSQPGAELEVFQSESLLPQTPMEGLVAGSLPQSLGTAVLSFERPLPKGSPIQVSFLLTDDGTLQVRGSDLTTGTVVETGFKTEGVIDESELEGRRLALRARAYDDLTTQTANELDAMARQASQHLPETALQLRQLRDAVTGDSQDAAWAASRPEHSFDLDLITASSNRGWQRFLFVTESLRNFLLFSPVMFTWYASGRRWRLPTPPSPNLKSKPFCCYGRMPPATSTANAGHAAMTNRSVRAGGVDLVVQFSGNLVERGKSQGPGRRILTPDDTGAPSSGRRARRDAGPTWPRATHVIRAASARRSTSPPRRGAGAPQQPRLT